MILSYRIWAWNASHLVISLVTREGLGTMCNVLNTLWVWSRVCGCGYVCISAYPLLGAYYLTIYGYKHMRLLTRFYGSCSVCLCVATLAAIFISLRWGVIELFMAFKRFVPCEFCWNGQFSSSGVICLQPPPSTLPDKLSMYRVNSSGFFSRQTGCTFSDSSYKTQYWLITDTTVSEVTTYYTFTGSRSIFSLLYTINQEIFIKHCIVDGVAAIYDN